MTSLTTSEYRLLFVGMPLMGTLALHAVVIYLLTTNWQPDHDVLVQPKQISRVIDARLIDAEALRPKPKPAKPKPVPPKPRKIQKTKPKPESQKPEKKQPRIIEEPAPAPSEPSEPRLTAEELASIARADLAEALESEASEQRVSRDALSESQLADSYAALIREVIANNWSRPPSARNGMEVLLSIQLIPTGEVISVSVLRSSGNTAFDRSAMNAVEMAERFPELQKMPPRLFERQFRRFRLLFKPEDLRY